MSENSENPDYRKNIVDIMVESQDFRSLIFHIASIPAAERSGLTPPPNMEKSWNSIIDGNNADYAVLNYYMRLGILK